MVRYQIRYSSWSKIRYLLHTSGHHRHFVRCSSGIRYTSHRYSSRCLYLSIFKPQNTTSIKSQ